MTATAAERIATAETTAAERHPSRQEPERFPWLAILMLGFAGFAGFVGLAVELSPAGLLNTISVHFDVSLATVGTLTTAFALGNALLVLPLTSLAMRFGRRSALVAVMAVFVIGNLVVAVAPSIEIADVGRFVAGASFAVQCSLIPAVAVRIAGPRFAGRAMAVVLGANALGMALGASLASILGMAAGWRVTFVVAAAIAAFIGVMFAITVPRIHTAPEHRLSLLAATRLPGVLRVCITWALLMLGHFVVLTYIDAYVGRLGLPSYVTSVSLFVLGIGGMIGIALVGQISRRSYFAALVVAPSAVAVALGVIATGVNSLPVVLILIALWGFGFSGTILIAQQTILLLGRRAPETAMSVGILLAQLGFALGATIGGLVVTYLGIGIIPLVAVIFVLGAVGLAVSLRGVVHRAQVDQTREQQQIVELAEPVLV